MNRVAKIKNVSLTFGANVKVVSEDVYKKMTRDRSFDFATKFNGDHQFNGQTLKCQVKRQWFPVAEGSFKDGRKNVKGMLVAQAFEYDAGDTKDYMENLTFVTKQDTDITRIKEVTLEFSGKGAIVNPVPTARYNAIVNARQTFNKAYTRDIEFEGKAATESTQRVNIGTCSLGTIAREASIVKSGNVTLKYFYSVRIYSMEAAE
jgi:hypothetical protein